jgi:hypothetical protein
MLLFLNKQTKAEVQGAMEASHAAAKVARRKSALMMFLELGTRWDAKASVRAISRWHCKSEVWSSQRQLDSIKMAMTNHKSLLDHMPDLRSDLATAIGGLPSSYMYSVS